MRVGVRILVALLLVAPIAGCPGRIAYVARELPETVPRGTRDRAVDASARVGRGGFLPEASNAAEVLLHLEGETGSRVLVNADVVFNRPNCLIGHVVCFGSDRGRTRAIDPEAESDGE